MAMEISNNYSFVAASYTKGIKYSSNSTVNLLLLRVFWKKWK